MKVEAKLQFRRDQLTREKCNLENKLQQEVNQTRDALVKQKYEINIAKNKLLEEKDKQERWFQEKKEQIDHDEDLLSKIYVPLGQTKLKVMNEETTEEPASIWVKCYDGKGLWKRSLPTFPSPMRKPKVKQKLTEFMIDADGFISDSDVPLDSRAEIELIKQQLSQFKRKLNNQPILLASPKKKQKIESTSAKICDSDETIVRTDESSE